MRVPGGSGLLDDPDGPVRGLRVPGGRRAGASHHRHALRRHRLHHGRPPRHPAQVRPPHGHDVLAQAGPGLRPGSCELAVGDRGRGVLPHPGAPGPGRRGELQRLRRLLPHVLSAAAPEQVQGQRLLDPLGQGRVQLHHPARAGLPRHAHLHRLHRERDRHAGDRGGVPDRAHHGRRLHAVPPLRALPDAGYPLPVSRPVLLHQPGAGREAEHRLRRLVLDRDAPRPHQDACQRGARGASQRGVRAARLVVPRARRLGRPGQPVRLPRVQRQRADLGR